MNIEAKTNTRSWNLELLSRENSDFVWEKYELIIVILYSFAQDCTRHV